MTKVTDTTDVWILRPTVADLRQGAHYAAISLPWTFNRMALNTNSTGRKRAALNIAKGIVGQQVLKRKMEEVGIRAETQRKSHRDDDLFDFRAEIDGKLTRMDLKTFHYYRDHAPFDRKPFSVQFLMQNAGYAGADWRRFFPTLVPHTQIEQSKEAYCFAIGHSFDIRNDITTDRSDYALTAFPCGRHLEFLSSQKLCRRRENANEGFYVELAYRATELFAQEVTVTVIGEWMGELTEIPLTLGRGVVEEAGPFSCINSFQMDVESYQRLGGSIAMSLTDNDYNEPVFNTSMRNINRYPRTPFVITKDDFCNLVLPNEYTLYVMGWIYKDDFLRACRKYQGWVWPRNAVDPRRNQAWNQLTDRDRKLLARKGFADAMGDEGDALQAGWLKTTGRGNGACCYVFPNVGGAWGGVRETNLYVLPQDLYTMATLQKGERMPK